MKLGHMPSITEQLRVQVKKLESILSDPGNLIRNSGFFVVLTIMSRNGIISVGY